MDLSRFVLLFHSVRYPRVDSGERSLHMRSRNVPHCWYCGASKVTLCRTRLGDTLPRLSMLVPLRCLGCLTRFYGLRGALPLSGEFARVRRPHSPVHVHWSRADHTRDSLRHVKVHSHRLPH